MWPINWKNSKDILYGEALVIPQKFSLVDGGVLTLKRNGI